VAPTLRIFRDGHAPRSRWVYRFDYDGTRHEAGPVDSLDALAALLQRWGAHLEGLPWTELPTFGGPAPARTEDVWSWDETRLLEGSQPHTARLRPRV
jgi:hypothetical protein